MSSIYILDRAAGILVVCWDRHTQIQGALQILRNLLYVKRNLHSFSTQSTNHSYIQPNKETTL